MLRAKTYILARKTSLLRSRNAGAQFTPIPLLLKQNQVPITAIFADANNSNMVYVGVGNTLYTTANKGNSWSVSVFEDLKHNINFFWVNPRNSQIRYIGSNYYE